MPDAATAEQVRDAGELESAYDFWSRRHPSHFCVAVELAGSIGPADVVDAVRALAARHVLLSSDLVPDDGQVALGAFVHHGQAPAVRVLDGPTPLDAIIAEELATPFPAARPTSRLRAAVVPRGPSPQESGWAVVIVIDHQVADGISGLRLVADLVALLEHRDLPDPVVSPSREQALEHAAADSPPDGPPSDDGAASPESSLPPAAVRPFDGSVPQVRLEALSVEETTALVERTRSEGATVGGALVAACLRALSDEDFVRVNVPVDLRPRTGSTIDVGLMMGNANLTFEQPFPADFWPLARQTSEDIRAQTTVPVLNAASRAIAGAMHAGLDERALEPALVAGLGFELLISNLGVFPEPSTSGAVQVDAVWGPAVLVQIQGERMLGITTSGGRLRVVHVSHEPWPDVLGPLRSQLV